MGTHRITLNELKTLVKEIIKEGADGIDSHNDSVFMQMHNGVRTGEGSFNVGLQKLFYLADYRNKRKLVDAFPEFFGDSVPEFGIKKKIMENFASNDFYKKEKNNAINYLKDNEYNWVTIEYDETYNTVRIYQGHGLDPERDGIDKDDIDNNYMELEGHEVLDMIKNGVQPILMEV